LPILWWVATWDGTWLWADLCEGRQRRKLLNELHVRQKHIKKKKINWKPVLAMKVTDLDILPKNLEGALSQHLEKKIFYSKECPCPCPNIR
jgi:hypothetical protein